jgi:hypothetical protein
MTRACEKCGARLSRYAPAWETRCLPCEPALRCKRGHDLVLTGRIVKREEGRTTLSCAACKRIRDADYARTRRAQARLEANV